MLSSFISLRTHAEAWGARAVAPWESRYPARMPTPIRSSAPALASSYMLAALLAPPVAARQIEPALRTADSLVAEWVDAERVPGAVLLVSRGDRVVLERAYGWARLFEYDRGEYRASSSAEPVREALRRIADPRRMTPATVFDLASVTKVMATTMAVMLLVDDRTLDLDAPLHTYLPDFRGDGKDEITLRHLLTHRSGLYPWQPIYYHATSAADAYAYIRDLPLASGVGEGRHYSDLGFMLLGLVVESASGMRLDAFLREELYGPLGLTATGFRPDAAAGTTHTFAATSHGNPYEYRMVHDSAFGYRIDGDPSSFDGWRRRTLAGDVNDGNAYHAFGGVAGHAGLFSTAEELQVLLRLLLDRGEYGGRRYLRAETVDAFLAPTGDGQASGWQIPGYAPTGSFSHTGFTGTFVLGVPAQRIGVILLTNRQNVGVDERGYYPDVGPLQRAVTTALTGLND